MLRKPTLVASALVAATALATSPATAGEKTALSALPLLPAPHDASEPPKKMGVAGMSLKEERSVYTGTTYLNAVANASRGYCFVSKEDGIRVQVASSSSPNEDELWRFTEADGKASLERSRVQVIPSERTAWLKSHTKIELQRIAHTGDVDVWAFRESSGEVVVLARGGDSGRESPWPGADNESFRFVASDCTWGATRLHTKLAKTGALAQLHGSLPPASKRKGEVVTHFIVDASISKVTRDPEPIVAVSVRRLLH